MTLETESINLTIEALHNLAEEIDDIAPSEFIDKMLSKGEKILKGYNQSAPKSGLRDNIVSSFNNKNGSGTLILSGKNAIYDEFGTGEEGRADPHPLKSYYNLNEYNSGPTIYYNQWAGRTGWNYKPMAGKPYFEVGTGFTSGVPSGKMVFNTANDLNRIKIDIATPVIKKATKKFK